MDDQLFRVAACLHPAAPVARLQGTLNFSNREAGAAVGCFNLFAPALLLLIVPVLV